MKTKTKKTIWVVFVEIFLVLFLLLLIALVFSPIMIHDYKFTKAIVRHFIYPSAITKLKMEERNHLFILKEGIFYSVVIIFIVVDIISIIKLGKKYFFLRNDKHV